MTNFKTIVETFIQDMEYVDPGKWDDVTSEDFYNNFERDLTQSMLTFLPYCAGKFPEEMKTVWHLDELEDMAEHIKSNWEN